MNRISIVITVTIYENKKPRFKFNDPISSGICKTINFIYFLTSENCYWGSDYNVEFGIYKGNNFNHFQSRYTKGTSLSQF